MYFLDAFTCMVLALRIHGTDEAVRDAGSACLLKVKTMRERKQIRLIIESDHPAKLVAQRLSQIPDCLLGDAMVAENSKRPGLVNLSSRRKALGKPSSFRVRRRIRYVAGARIKVRL